MSALGLFLLPDHGISCFFPCVCNMLHGERSLLPKPRSEAALLTRVSPNVAAQQVTSQASNS